MEDLFRVRALTTAVNNLKTPQRKIFGTLFAGKTHMVETDRIAFDVIGGSEGILRNISIHAPAEVTEKTGRKTVTLQAPRLAHKRFIHTAEMNAMRSYGEQAAVELLANRLNRELTDMRNMVERTLEFWAASVLGGKILDADGTTLVDYNLQSTHKPVLGTNEKWTDSGVNPIKDIRKWKRLIEQDHGGEIQRWIAFVGYEAMDALVTNTAVLDLLKYDAGRTVAEQGDVARLVGCDLIEVTGTYVDSLGQRQPYVPSTHFVLVGYSDDAFDCPYAPVVDSDAPQGVGNLGPGEMFFAKSWPEQDPSGRWVKVEARPLPVLQRPGAVVYAKVK